MGSIAVIGASSFVGADILVAAATRDQSVWAVSRRGDLSSRANASWLLPSDFCEKLPSSDVQVCLSLAPIWTLQNYFPAFERSPVRRIIALSSTSAVAKADSPDAAEQAAASKIATAEQDLINWASAKGVEYVIMRPTLIYGYGKDRNVSSAARLIDRLGFFPLCGSASGLRQPVHASDVAQACITAAELPAAANRTLVVAGGSTLSYREMIGRVFHALGKPARMPSVPLVAWQAAAAVSRLVGARLNYGAAYRMNQDQAFSAQSDMALLGITPRAFEPVAADLGF